jgi:hypothetical protein
MLKAILSSFLLATSVAASAAPPARVELAYELTRNGSHLADIVRRLEHGKGSYQISERWKGRGLFALRGEIRVSSRGVIAADGLRPLEYIDERTGRDTERAKFDWSAKTATIQYQGPEKTIPFPPRPTDELAALFGFAFVPPRQEVAIDVIGGRGVSDRVFRNEGRERLKTAAGEFDALRMVRRKDNGDRAEIWLATDRAYLPVRILIVGKDGTRLDQVVTTISTP